MTSPITEEKIIEVLRPFVETDIFVTKSGDDGLISVSPKDVRAARDLYQRLQAEKEGGWQPIETAPNEGDILIFGGRHERVEIALADGDYWRRGRKDGLKAIPTHWRHLPAPPLNQEGGDAPETAGRDSSSEVGKHVAPLASANAGTGRATEELVTEARALVEDGDSYGTRARNVTTIYTRQIIERLIEALASERQRGLAEGERIGIEKAAKVAEDYPSQVLMTWDRPGGPPGNGYVPSTPKHVAASLRALNTGDPQT